ncbi:hypothetical protein FQN54_009250 [Arachnomyces sp. PD_36]|nr:hypothetical protein FQN54_009250 [Arachnomyces sp. PD_36]
MAEESEPPHILASELRARFLAGQKPGQDFILIDLRGSDFRGGTIHGSFNIPMQSVAFALPSLYSLASAAGVPDVIWYCGSSCGRGLRGAALFADYVKEQGSSTPRSMVLKGGINGWVESGKEYTDLIDGYEAEAWQQAHT